MSAKPSVLIVGSGAGASVAAWELTRAGFPVTLLEKGRNLLPGLGTAGGIGSLFGNDEVKEGRFFENQDPVLEPRTARTQTDAQQGTDRSFVGDVNDLPTVVGGGTVHWDAKTPRFWQQDFKALSLYGPVPDANVADWPFEYKELAPFYDEVETQLGVQGDVKQMPPSTLDAERGAPRKHQFPQPPNPPMYSGLLLKEGARRVGYTAYPFPMAVNSQTFDGRPPCNSCGFCSGFGCPINARGGAAVSFLHHALLAGANLVPRAYVTKIQLSSDEKRATGVHYLDASGAPQFLGADVVILAASAIETARLLLLSATGTGRHAHGLGNGSDLVGRNLMFHFFTIGVGLFAGAPHSWRGPSTTFTMDDFVGPDTSPAAEAFASTAGLPYLKGGICEVGGGTTLLREAGIYTSFPNSWGHQFKALMRSSPFRAHLAGLSMVGEDMPQLANRVDLDPTVKDWRGIPAPRITRSAHRFELAASTYYGPKLQSVCAAAPGAVASGWVPIATIAEASGGDSSSFAGFASTAHIMGTARMGSKAESSVVDPHGQLWGVENLFVGDGSVFVSSGGFNPTLTIMALSLRMAQALTKR